jgi:CHASE2 domain-containing sensor protein
VILQAQMISQIISAVEGKRPLIKVVPLREEILWVWSWCIIAGLLAWNFRLRIHLVFAGIITLSILYVVCYLLLLQGYWMPYIPAILVIAITGACLSLIIYPIRLGQNVS